ncbi:MAG TPA: hypothetical protein VGD68_06610 [Streptosporangiaceae bacterium]
MRFTSRSLAAVVAALIPIGALGAAGAGAALAAPGGPATAAGQPAFSARTILSGTALSHAFAAPGGTHHEHLSSPDDITRFGHELFAAFQNGVGPQGQASPSGNTDSTVVEFTTGGHVVRQWDLHGKCDGLTADPQAGVVIATVNEDLHSSLYTIAPGARPARQVQHYTYREALPHHGGTDAISIYHGEIFISASAPGTTGPAAPDAAYPAVYRVGLCGCDHVATVHPLFYDEATASVANAGSARGTTTHLALTDPDSNEVVPASAARFGGDFMVTSQGDQQQIFVRGAAGRHPGLSVLNLSRPVDDTAWPASRPGAIFATSTATGTVVMVTGPFRPGTEFAAVTPCDASSAPATCPAPPAYPVNYLGTVNPWSGHVSAVTVTGAALQPQGMLFVSW